MRAAVQDLRALIDAIAERDCERVGKLAWGRNWFATIGHDEMHPSTLGLFAVFWADLYIAAHKSLEAMIIA